MEIEEAIQTSIKYETEVRDLYIEAEKNATDPIGKRVFKVLVPNFDSCHLFVC